MQAIAIKFVITYKIKKITHIHCVCDCSPWLKSRL